MDEIEVDSERESVPDWAKTMAPPGAPNGMSGAKITDKQRSFLLDLIGKKYIKPGQEGKLDLIMKCLRISEDPEEYGMSKDKASELITWFLKQPNKPPTIVVTDGVETSTALSGLPSGRYALPKAGTDLEDNELRFYQCWESRDKKAKRIYVMFGPREARLPFPVQENIAKMITDAGVRECAIRYGMEIGSCSNCGRRLTNRISRELGIGPICGGRMFGSDDWKDEVKTKRAEIVARGFDPDEDVD
jgi:Family of unknown function (DUF6011)